MTSLVLLCLGLMRNFRQTQATVVDFITAALAFTMASPIAWDHHYGFLPVVFVILGVELVAAPPSARRARLNWLLGIAFLLSSRFLP